MTDADQTPNPEHNAERSDAYSPPPPADEAKASATQEAQGQEAATSGMLDAHEKEITRLREEVMRAQAQVENMRQRTRRDVANAHTYGAQKLIESMLPVMDSLEQALAACQEHKAPAMFREGVELIRSMLTKALESAGLVAIAPQAGEPYNPDWHEAITTQPSDEHPTRSILQVVQTGYRLKERTLRAAKVIVVG